MTKLVYHLTRKEKKEELVKEWMDIHSRLLALVTQIGDLINELLEDKE